MTTACQPCTAASVDPRHGQYQAACLECKARSIANSPAFHDAQIAKNITPAYRAILDQAFGMDWESGHERAKVWSKAIKQGTKNA